VGARPNFGLRELVSGEDEGSPTGAFGRYSPVSLCARRASPNPTACIPTRSITGRGDNGDARTVLLVGSQRELENGPEESNVRFGGSRGLFGLVITACVVGWLGVCAPSGQLSASASLELAHRKVDGWEGPDGSIGFEQTGTVQPIDGCVVGPGDSDDIDTEAGQLPE
jgi:hypothetical protein